MSLDDRLGLGFDTVHEERQPDSIKIRWHLGKDSISDIKHAILSDLLEIIGEDKKQPRPLGEESRARFYRVGGQNFTKNELREKIKAYCK